MFSFPNTTFTSPTGESIDLTKGLVASQFINANQPGTVSTILEIPRIFDKNDNVVVDSFRKKITTPGLVPTYPKSVSDDREDDLKVLDATLQKLSLIFASENAELTKTMKEDARGFKVSSPLIEALEFLGKNFKNVFSMKEVVNVYDSLNNGSHYFKAVEIFLRGASGINFAKNSTPNWAPQSSDDHSGIINMSIDHLERALLAWGNRQGNSSFLFENDNFVADYDFRTYVPMDK